MASSSKSRGSARTARRADDKRSGFARGFPDAPTQPFSCAKVIPAPFLPLLFPGKLKISIPSRSQTGKGGLMLAASPRRRFYVAAGPFLLVWSGFRCLSDGQLL